MRSRSAFSRPVSVLAAPRVPSRSIRATPETLLLLLLLQLGWQDVGWREVAPGVLTDMAGATDFIDGLAATGIKLDQMYVSPVCSPTRAQLM